MTNKHALKTHLIKFLTLICCLSVGNATAQEATSPVAVSVTTARRGTIVSTKQYNGHLEPQAEVQVFANVSGKIVALGQQSDKMSRKAMYSQRPIQTKPHSP